MAYAITASKWLEDKRYIEAVLDSASDLAALGSGYAPDSRAIVAEGGAAYMTDASGQWQELGSPGGGGGSSVTVEPLTVTQNGTQTAPSGKAFNPVTTNVPNSYGASDEGKVVSNGALVAQTTHAPVTQNGTIDTTLYNSVPVNVPGGGALQVKTVILMPGETGSISPDSGYAGMSRVDYDVGPAPTIYRAERSTEIEGFVLYEFPLYVDSFVIGTAPGGQIGLCFLSSAPYSFLVNAPESGETGNFQGDAYLFPILNGTNPNMYPQYIYAISPD